MAQFQYLITDIEGGVGILQLNHPKKRNALGWELRSSSPWSPDQSLKPAQEFPTPKLEKVWDAPLSAHIHQVRAGVA